MESWGFLYIMYIQACTNRFIMHMAYRIVGLYIYIYGYVQELYKTIKNLGIYTQIEPFHQKSGLPLKGSARKGFCQGAFPGRASDKTWPANGVSSLLPKCGRL